MFELQELVKTSCTDLWLEAYIPSEYSALFLCHILHVFQSVLYVVFIALAGYLRWCRCGTVRPKYLVQRV